MTVYGPELDSKQGRVFRTMPSAFTLDTVVVAAANQVSANMGGEEVILDLTAGIYYGLDEVGARIWSLIGEPRSVASILDAILSEYEVEPDRCLTDLQELLESLSKAKLVEVQSA